MAPKVKLTITIIGVIAGLFHLYSGGIGSFSAMTQTSLHWLFMATLAFLIVPYKKDKVGVFDFLCAAIALGACAYVVLTWQERVDRVSTTLDFEEFAIGILLILITLETARKSTGTFLTVTAALFLVYAYVGPWLPGILYHKGYSIDRIISFICYSENGIYGSALSISSTFIVLFVLFGAFLQACNGGKLFIDIAYALTGWARGGPAKTAVLSSMLMGTISGSPIANVVTTGTFTIPLMKKAGYAPHQACAVEAVASTGGMIMPPVMGAAAFIMAEYLNMTYGQIIVAAFIPALLYYASLFFMVDFLAIKNGLVGLPRKSLPPLKATLKMSFHLFLPLVGLIYFLVIGWSAMKTVFWATVFLIIIAALRANTRINFKGFISALKDGIGNTVPVAVACAAAGIIVGVVGLTGLGVKFSSSLLALSGGSPVLALIVNADLILHESGV